MTEKETLKQTLMEAWVYSEITNQLSAHTAIHLLIANLENSDFTRWMCDYYPGINLTSPSAQKNSPTNISSQ